MKLVYGVGINDLDYVSQRYSVVNVDGTFKRKREWACQFYLMWKRMLERCFCEKLKQKKPTYRGVTCCDDWLYASRFKDWAQEQDWQGKELDKDIIIRGNGVYSPESCAFVLQSTNKFVSENDTTTRELPTGVSWKKQNNKLQAQCHNPFTNKYEYLGLFLCSQQAHEAWRKRKHQLAQLVAETESDPRVVEALKKRYSYEEWYKHNSI